MDRQITAIIGPNGAGKTTLFNCITGFYRPRVGRLALRAADGRKFLLERMDGFRIAQQARVARTFQNTRLFPRVSVLENLMVAQHDRLMRALRATRWRACSASASTVGRGRPAVKRTGTGWTACGCSSERMTKQGPFPKEQRRLEVARAMCTEPALLCLDEPAAGLNARESSELNKLLL